jgi:hypothetical protein
MLQIKDLLGKFKNVEDPREIRAQIASALNVAIKADLLTESNIEYKRSIVRINANPAIKHKIMTSKQVCLNILNQTLGGHVITDIH